MPNTMLIITDESTLREIVAAEVTPALLSVLPELLRRAALKPWLSAEEVEDLTGFSKRQLKHLRETRRVVFSQTGRKIVYQTASVESLLAEGTVHTR